MRRGSLVLLAGVLAGSAHANILIDDFTTGFNSGATSTPFYYDTVAGGALGGHRYIDHRFTSNPLNRPILTDVNAGAPGNLFIEAGSGVNGQVFVVWAGRITSAPTSGPGALPRGDFFGQSPLVNMSGEQGLLIDYINNDQSNTGIYAEMWDVNFNVIASSFSTIGAGFGSVYRGFNSFSLVQGASFDMTQVKGIAVGVSLPTGNDITLTRVAAVPEPATMTVLGLGIAALAARKRRK
ncbi:MAG: PEP-CTERM sorting domain-containing protein [Fimbriimonadaceae bacterium]